MLVSVVEIKFYFYFLFVVIYSLATESNYSTLVMLKNYLTFLVCAMQANLFVLSNLLFLVLNDKMD